MFVELTTKGDLFKSAQAYQNTVKNRIQYFYLQLYADHKLNRGKTGETALKLVQDVN